MSERPTAKSTLPGVNSLAKPAEPQDLFAAVARLAGGAVCRPPKVSAV
jgi:hypothetical protein